MTFWDLDYLLGDTYFDKFVGNEAEVDHIEGTEAKHESVATLADVIINDPTDAQSRIENAGEDTSVWIQPGLTIDAANIQFNEGQRIIAYGATIQKAADGPIATRTDRVKIFGGTYDGNKSSYTGNGVVDATPSTAVGFSHRVVKDATVINCAGSGWVIDSEVRFQYNRIDVQFNDEWGIKFDASVGIDGSRRGKFNVGLVQENGTGGLVVMGDDGINNVEFNLTVLNNSGPAYEYQSKSDIIKFRGSMRDNDGPAIFGNGSQLPQCVIKANINDNLANPTRPTTAQVGDLHDEGNSSGNTIRLSSPGIYNGSQDADNVFYNGDLERHYVQFDGMRFIGQTAKIRGRATAVGIMSAGVGAWVEFNQDDGGIMVNTRDNYIINHLSDTKIYLNELDSNPHAASGSGDIYMDYSTNPPKWQVDDPTDSEWENPS